MPTDLNKELHDEVIKSILPNLYNAELTINLLKKSLIFYGVVLFRTESYFNIKDSISSRELYISSVQMTDKSYLLDEVRSQNKINGEKKWGDNDLKYFNFRDDNLIHVNIYCVDWEFDIICREFKFS